MGSVIVVNVHWDGAVAAGKVVPPVMVPKGASAVTIPVVMAPAALNSELQVREDKRIAELNRKYAADRSYYEDEFGMRHYTDGREVMVIYEKR